MEDWLYTSRLSDSLTEGGLRKEAERFGGLASYTEVPEGDRVTLHLGRIRDFKAGGGLLLTI